MGILEYWGQGYRAGRDGTAAVVPPEIAAQGSKAAKAWREGWLMGEERRQRDHDRGSTEEETKT